MGKKIRKNAFPPELKKYCELSAEGLGTYLLNYLEELKCNVNTETTEVHDRDSLHKLILLFQEKVKKIQSNSMKSSKLRRELEFQFDVLAKRFNDIFFPSAPPAPSQKIKIISERGRLIPIDCNCIQCSMKLNQGWRYHTNIGEIYFCTLCKEKFFGVGNFKPVNPWSKIVFSAFETNRRKH